jgi:dolichyl-phosphate-mannose--protein O-mannosyl transferase
VKELIIIALVIIAIVAVVTAAWGTLHEIFKDLFKKVLTAISGLIGVAIFCIIFYYAVNRKTVGDIINDARSDSSILSREADHRLLEEGSGNRQR